MVLGELIMLLKSASDLAQPPGCKFGTSKKEELMKLTMSCSAAWEYILWSNHTGYMPMMVKVANCLTATVCGF